MDVSRRGAMVAVSLFGLSVAAAGSGLGKVLAFGDDIGREAQADGEAVSQYGFLVDTVNCVSCGNCVTACRNYNGTPEDEPARRKIVRYDLADDERRYISVSCMHCEEPSCMVVCPARAISKVDGGVVDVDGKRCIGCGYCSQACPFGIPNIGRNGMDKCDCCLGNGVMLGDSPHCVDACHFDALHFGPVDALVGNYGARARRVMGFTKPAYYLA